MTLFVGDTNGGANRFFFDGDGDILVSGADVGGRPQVSGKLNVLADVWGGSVTATGTFNGPDADPNIFRAQENGIAVIGGSDTGGSYRFQFDSQEDAQRFIDFARDIHDQGALVTLFEGKETEFSFAAPGASGSGVTSISFDDGQDDRIANFRAGGSGVSGSVQETSLEAFIFTLAEDVYDGVRVRSGSLAENIAQRVADGKAPTVRLNDDDVILTNNGMGGQFRWDFDSPDQASRFQTALDHLFDAIDNTEAVAQDDLFA